MPKRMVYVVSNLILLIGNSLVEKEINDNLGVKWALHGVFGLIMVMMTYW